ncbi:type VI secretion system Vgr family protein [sulfur-oxidizing endosymbiont of Gigantopelta aegis]|uniref:type VI secretion system Vgr family protein n=1 Tax=sulfur-oxidizing endosymbiont of Gigantopelta aegis TaxID=2794934 RepID=UPI0018DB6FBE|nr:type VI secretion system tip protein TssI/VgrG [sulfur-oxidizing endosymbiont of Gigantopelta aegis]
MYELRLSADYSPKEYCVQYQESEFDFISRLMAENGIHYHFEHALDKHLMVIADHNGAFPFINIDKNVQYHPNDSLNADQEVINRFNKHFSVQYGSTHFRDYAFKKPLDRLNNHQQSDYDSALEDYQCPGDYDLKPSALTSSGRQKTTLKLQQHQTFREQSQLASNCQRLRAGMRYELYDNPNGQYNQQYLLTHIDHEAEQPQSLDEFGSGNPSTYRNKGKCIPAITPYKMPVTDKKPNIIGYQSSAITGPSGEEIYTNEHAQSKVQFPWDREGQQDENSSCWLRSSQTWAGKHWGSIVLPRMGQEAKVGYLHGDPDRPLITGRLYNERHKPPYALPKHKTRTTIKSNSTLGGKGYNEIRIEDRKAQEQVYFHAEKDIDIRAKNDRRDIIKHDRHLIVDNNRYEFIKDSSHHTIDNNQNEKTAQNHSIKISNNQHSKAGQAVLADIANNAHFKAGQKIILEAGSELTIKAGGGFIKIDASGVTAQGAAIQLNGGTGAGPATAAIPISVTQAVEADKDKPGQVFKPIPPQSAPNQEKIAFKGEISRLLQAGNDNQQGICIPCMLKSLAKNEIIEKVLPNIIKSSTDSDNPLNPLPLESLSNNETKEKHWLELEHQTSFPDDKGQIEPAKEANYLLTLPNGQTIKGQLDSGGMATHKEMPAGIYSVEYEPDIDTEIKTKQSEIQQILKQILNDEVKEAAAIEKKLQDARFYGFDFPGSNALAQIDLYKKAAENGVWNGLTGLANFAWELLKGTGSLMYELALRSNPITAPFKFREDLKALKTAHKELQQFADEDLETYAALLSDDATHQLFKQFSIDYLDAQHSLEYTETGGQVVFDILLTIFTVGAGLAASARHLSKLKKLQPLLKQMSTLLKRKQVKTKKKGTHNTRIIITTPLKNPHHGLHNRDDLTPDLETSMNSFKTTRKIDMRDLSQKDEIISDILEDQNWDDRKIKQVLKSGDNFTEQSFNAGDKMYGFNTAGRSRNLDNSAYLLDEAGYQNVKKKYFKQGYWDKEGVKNYLALPCFNQANSIDLMEVTQPTTGLQSTIGKATELIRYDAADGYTTGTLGKIERWWYSNNA